MKTNAHIEPGLDEKYRYEEYFDLDGVLRRRYFTPSAWAKRQARQKMAERTARDPKPYTWRLGYNHVIGQFAQDDEYPSMSGSSLNRSLKPKKNAAGAKLFIEGPEKEPYQEPRVFSKRSRAKVKDKATAFWRSLESRGRKIPPKRTFATFTFIEQLPDQLGVEILNKFMTVLRKENANLQYLWVAEPQEENNNRIHFHMLLDRRLDIKRYNALWTLQQYNSGLRGRRANGDLISLEEIRQRYDHDMSTSFRKNDPDGVQAVLNPFSIEKATSITGLSSYLTQYITKQAADHQFGCLTWHCSRKVSKLFTKEVVSPSTFRYFCSFANSRVDFRTGEILQEPEPIVKQFFTMVYVHNKGAPLSRLKQMETVNRWIMEGFETDRLPELSDYLYRKLHCNEKAQEKAAELYSSKSVRSTGNGGNERRVPGEADRDVHGRLPFLPFDLT